MNKVFNKKPARRLLTVIAIAGLSSALNAHEHAVAHATVEATPNTEVKYLGNEALLFSNGETKILFDPFFHNDYGSYQLVPESIRDAIFSGKAPYDNVTAIVVSHAHGDHFAASDVAKYLADYPKVSLIAPSQATEKVLLENAQLKPQLVSLALEFGDSPITTKLGDITIDSVRIPHAGWPQRKDVANLVHRVTLANGKTIMHMGDADPNDEHFLPFADHWQQRQTHTAFPPYWFFLSNDGRTILQDRINALKAIGVHVPTDVPAPLKLSGAEYFSTPEETVTLD